MLKERTVYHNLTTTQLVNLINSDLSKFPPSLDKTKELLAELTAELAKGHKLTLKDPRILTALAKANGWGLGAAWGFSACADYTIELCKRLIGYVESPIQ